ncbi:acyl carrier protein [Microbispora sp. NEAU-D428]|uniref:acyl carrier protein n=1 Tax=Microbispora sitophila TaxID=2771537 RepID=UPI0018682D65|nr:acyl carrier protein [Microbispora sitophila]MBE3014108.1 acyl carrier protein [Microbispora sitophila]
MSSLNSAQDGPGFEQMLSEAFTAGLDLPAETDVTTLVFGQHRHWDSLGHMSLVITLEQTFGVSLEEKDVLEIDSYASAAAVLRSKDRGGS